MVWISVSLLTFMVTVKYSSNQMNNIIFSLKITLLLIIHLAKYQFHRPFAGNTDPKGQKCLYYRNRSVNTDPHGNPE